MKGIKNKFEIAQKHMENNKFKEIENTLLDKAKFRDPVKSIEDAHLVLASIVLESKT